VPSDSVCIEYSKPQLNQFDKLKTLLHSGRTSMNSTERHLQLMFLECLLVTLLSKNNPDSFIK